jgi:hypothetical protein
LHSHAPLDYYSCTDASISVAYKSLTKEQQARVDPMITDFNPTDMYAADHIRKVLQTFPEVFTGIGVTISTPVRKRQSLKFNYGYGDHATYEGNFQDVSVAWQYSRLGRPN